MRSARWESSKAMSLDDGAKPPLPNGGSQSQESSLIVRAVKETPFLLAPMAGVTDRPFRSFMRSMGCGAVTTELVSARALCERNSKSLSLMERHKGGGLSGVQIFGADAQTLSDGAKIAASIAQPDFIDLNLGCPVSKIVKKGAGAALMRDLKALTLILRSLRKAVSLPLSLKVRTGWDESHRSAAEAAHIAFNEGFSWMTIHGRTRAAAYSGKADWRYIGEVAEKSQIPIVGNGDILSAAEALQKLKSAPLLAVMIGRGCLSRPWIFQEAMTLLKGGARFEPEPLTRLLPRLFAEITEFYTEQRMRLIQMKKHAVWLSQGLPEAARFRGAVFQIKEEEEAAAFMLSFFTRAEREGALPYNPEKPLLKHGHG